MTRCAVSIHDEVSNAVRSFSEQAKLANMTLRHFQRLISVGMGPPIVRLFKRKVGVLDEDGDRWISELRQTPPGWQDGKAA
jgi:hypothetical protein